MTDVNTVTTNDKLPTDTASTPVLTYDGRKATIRLNRPRHHNRIEPDDLSELQAQLQAIENNAGIRVLILTGTGPSFSSGYHLGEMETPAEPASAPSPEPTPFAQAAAKLENLPIPTICAFNGSVYGGATDLGLACDFRIGVIGMRLRMPAAQLGVHYYAGGLRRYVERLGLAAAKKLFLTAITIETDELLRIGYLDEAVVADDLMATVDALAERLATNSPTAVCGMKYHLNRVARGCADDAAIDLAHAMSTVSDDAREGVAAWRQRRAPVFGDR